MLTDRRRRWAAAARPQRKLKADLPVVNPRPSGLTIHAGRMNTEASHQRDSFAPSAVCPTSLRTPPPKRRYERGAEPWPRLGRVACRRREARHWCRWSASGLTRWPATHCRPYGATSSARSSRCNTRRNLVANGRIVPHLAALEAAGVRAVPYKGPVLAAQAYGDIALRQFADLDIVVPQREIARPFRALASLGYRSDLDPSQARDSRFIARGDVGQISFAAGGIVRPVELHTEKTLRYFPVPLNWKELRPRLRTFR